MCWLGQGYEIGLNDNLSKLKETNIKYTFTLVCITYCEWSLPCSWPPTSWPASAESGCQPEIIGCKMLVKLTVTHQAVDYEVYGWVEDC